jgi:hypothetical protein
MPIAPVAQVPKDVLDRGLKRVREASRDAGRLELIAVRPSARTREVLTEADLDLRRGVVGDRWARSGKRFGVDAMKFVNSVEGRELRLRGVNARVVEPGTIRTGDTVRKA